MGRDFVLAKSLILQNPILKFKNYAVQILW